ncbi:MAG: hypothetical protein OHK0046_34390 [Anaerolineae bacterium]
MINRVIKDYQIRELIGEGGMGTVYRAHQSSVDRDVVIKVIREEYARDENFIRNFEYEARIIASLESPYIVPLYDFWREFDGAYMIMRYMRGGNLRSQLGRRWERDLVSAWLNQVARGLTTAHSKGVIHRDIKPDNILLDDEGNAFLADFGLASATTLEIEGQGYTPAYAAPEQIRREDVTSQSDIYSLGIVLFEVLTGERPFTDSTISDLEARHINDPLPSVSRLRPDLPADVNDVLQRATDKDPVNRYTSALQLSDAFQRAITGQPISRPQVIEPTIFNPYKGLEPFEYGDGANFFGRDQLIDRLVNRVRSERFLAVVGPSGSGKSSVVKAGLIPALKRGDVSNSNKWYIVEMIPGSNAFANLAHELDGVLNDPPPSLEEQLRTEETALGSLVRDLLPGDANAELLLVIDQFEELFTLNADDNRALFMRSLTHAVGDAAHRLRVLITLRADFYDRPLQVPDFGNLMREHVETVVPPNRAELEEAIVRPAQRVRVTPEPNLVNQIINDVGNQPGMLPLLQYALRELFEKSDGQTLTLRDYRALGGVAGALARSAESLYASLTREQQQRSRELFLNLVTVNDQMEATRRRVLRTELRWDPDTEAVIQLFGGARLLTFDNDPETRVPTVEVAHEALIRNWATLERWIEENRDELRVRRQLRLQARTWVESGLNPAFLAPEGPLAQYQMLLQTSTMAGTPEEEAFIKASADKLAEQERARIAALEERARIAEENERQQTQLLEQERMGAERQRQNARRLSALALVAVLLFLAAVVLAILANDSANDANVRGTEAATANVAALKGSTNVANAANTANANAITATIAQGQAEANATEAALANQTALAANATALSEGTNVALAVTRAFNAEQTAVNEADFQSTRAFEANAAALNESTNVANAANTANANAITATIAQGQAEANAATATVAQGQAVIAQEEAEANASEAALANQMALAANATALSEGTNVALAVTRAFNAEQTAVNEADFQSTRAFEANATALIESTNVANAASTANANATLANAEANRAATAQSEAEGNATEAFLANQQALEQATQVAAEATRAFENEQVALANAERAVTAEAEAVEQGVASQSRNLAAQAELLLGAGDYQLAASLALAANRIVDAPPEVQRVLSLAAYTGPRQIEEPDPFNPTNAVAHCGQDRFISAVDDGTLIYWQISGGSRLSQLGQFADHAAGVITIICDVDTGIAATGDRNGEIRVWSLDRTSMRSTNVLTVSTTEDDSAPTLTPSPTPITTTPGVVTPSPAERGGVLSLAFDPTYTYLLAGYEAVDDNFQGIMRLWDVENEEVAVQLVGHNDAVSGLYFYPDGTRLVSSALDGEMILWDTETLFLQDATFEYDISQRIQVGTAITSLVPNTAGDRLATTAEDGSVTIWDAETLQELGQVVGHSSAVRAAAFGVDDRGEQFLVSVGDDRNLILWDATSFRELRRYRAHESGVTSVAVNASAAFIMSAGLDRLVMLWDLKSGGEVTRREVVDVPEQFGLDLAGTKVVTASGSLIYLWDSSLRDVPVVYQGEGERQHTAPITALALSPAGDRILSGDQAGYVILWSTASGTPLAIRRWQAHDNQAVLSVAFSVDGNTAITGSTDRTLRLWAVDRAQDTGAIPTQLPTQTPSEEESVGSAVDVLAGSAGAVQSAAFCCTDPTLDLTSPRMNRVASGTDQGELFLWSFQGEATFDTLAGHQAAITSVAFSPDGTRLVSASTDNTLILWDVDPESEGYREPITTLRQHTGPVTSVDYSQDGTLLVSASTDRNVIVWDVESGAPISVLVGHAGPVNSVRFYPTGNRAISSGSDGRVIVWRVDERDELIDWIRVNREIPELTADTTIRGQNGCDLRTQYNIQPYCINVGRGLQLPTLTITPFATATATLTPTVTPSQRAEPTATLTLTPGTPLPPGQASETYLAALRDAGYRAVAVNYEAERRDLDVIDMSFRSDTVSWRSFDNVYGDFVLHTRIDWGAGSLQDRCGVLVRFRDRDNYYVLQVDQLGNVYFSERLNNTWTNDTQTVTDPSNVVSLGIENSTRDQVRLVIVGEGSTITAFVNEAWNVPIIFEADSRTEGYIALAATTFDRSREAGCLFTDSWIAEVGRSEPPPPTATPPEPPPLPYDIVEDIPSPPEIAALVLERLVENRPANTGYLAEQSARLQLDLSEQDNSFFWLSVETGMFYTDFIVRSTFTFDVDSVTDRCGVVFREVNGDNFYALVANPQGELALLELERGNWAANRFLNGAALRLAAGEQNEMIIVGMDVTENEDALPESVFTFFINGQYAGEIRDGSNQTGGVSLAAETGDNSLFTRCLFEDVWVWNLDANEPPPLPPRQDPIMQGELTRGTPVEALLETGARHIWTYSGQAGEQVEVRVEAERPANAAPPEARITRRLLDVELLVTYTTSEGDEETFLAYGGDVLPGRETNSRLELTLPVAGTYRFEIYSFQDATRGPYTLTLSTDEEA